MNAIDRILINMKLDSFKNGQPQKMSDKELNGLKEMSINDATLNIEQTVHLKIQNLTIKAHATIAKFAENANDPKIVEPAFENQMLKLIEECKKVKQAHISSVKQLNSDIFVENDITETDIKKLAAELTHHIWNSITTDRIKNIAESSVRALQIVKHMNDLI